MTQKITQIKAREILDSRGNPTLEVTVTSSEGLRAWASVPSGASTGEHEAHELRDGDKSRYDGKGVLKAIANVNGELAENLIEARIDVTDQKSIDARMNELDGTPSKSRLGANAILGVSLAVCRLGAMVKGVKLYEHIADLIGRRVVDLKLPTPMFNIINGGKHADSGLAIQEFKVVPRGIEDFAEQVRAGAEIFHALQKRLIAENFRTGVGNEGGFAPRLSGNEQALTTIVAAIEDAGYEPGKEVFLAIDAAASSFFDSDTGLYNLTPEGVGLSAQSLTALYRQWIDKHHLISVEDGLEENDWEGWSEMNKSLGSEAMVVGDDLLVTNVKRLKEAIDRRACNAALIKPNQIGTVSETLSCIALAHSENMTTIVSHRSGDTCDNFIADLAVGAGSAFIKSGAPSRSERTSKYNRLLAIDEFIKS